MARETASRLIGFDERRLKLHPVILDRLASNDPVGDCERPSLDFVKPHRSIVCEEGKRPNELSAMDLGRGCVNSS